MPPFPALKFSNPSWVPSLLACCLLALAAEARGDEESVPIKNPGFEDNYHAASAGTDGISGEIAGDWGLLSRPGSVVQLARDEDSPQEGKASQRIEVKQADGAVEFFQRVPLKKDLVYRARVWLRADRFLSAGIAVRQPAPPYQVSFAKTVEISPEWREYEVRGPSPSDGSPLLLLALRAPGTVWIDAVRIESVAPSPSVVREGNLFPDGSFEAGLSGGWGAYIRSGQGTFAESELQNSVEHRPEIDPTSATDGEKSLRLRFEAGMGGIVTSPLIETAPNRAYTASIALRADHKCKVELALGGLAAKKQVELGPEWQRFAIGGMLTTGAPTRLNVTAWPKEGATIWYDAAQLEQGETDGQTYHPEHPVELGLGVTPPGGIFFDGEPALIHLATGGSLPANSRLHWTLQDLRGGSKPLPDVALPAETFEIPPDPDKPRGLFKVRGEVVDAQGAPLSAPVEMIFARLPHPRDIDPDTSYYGVHVRLDPESLAIARAVGFRWVRLHDASLATKWATVEPARGAFVFVDNGVDAARLAGFRVLGLLDGAPAWASVVPRATTGYNAAYNMPDVPDSQERWAEYVTKTVDHYKGRIDYWEVWNEPWGKGFFPGTPEQYGALLKGAYEAAKAANPKSVVVGVDTAAHKVEWARSAMKVAGSGSYDLFSFHDYNNSLYGGPKSNGANLAALFNNLQREFGEAKPLWDTECNAGGTASWYYTDTAEKTGGVPPDQQMSHLVRFDVTQIGAGVQRTFFYGLHGTVASGVAGLITLEHDHTIRAALVAQAILSYFTDGARCEGRDEPQPGVDAYAFAHGDGHRATVLWGYDGQSHTVPRPPDAKVYDVLGNPISGNPVILSGEPIYFVQDKSP